MIFFRIYFLSLLLFGGIFSNLKGHCQVVDQSFTAQTGEPLIQISTIITADLETAWQLFSTQSGIESWMVSQATIDFKRGGNLWTNANPDAKMGDEGTVKSIIVSYLPYEMICFETILPESIPKRLRKQNDRLQEIIRFRYLGNERTEIISTSIGYGNGKEWQALYDAFRIGNLQTYQKLYDLFEKKEVEEVE